MGPKGTLVEAKIRPFKCPKCVCLASKSVPFKSKTVQMLNLALIETKRITVHVDYDSKSIPKSFPL